ncbi:hypothetical protein [Mesorhizobium sp. LNJC384A00]|uniref:hypothetical protein n=1 Tax=unclassified Mesorhizobium TaxID=325217 RepID=UPI0004156C96|nr:hypothetical protein [Mesorhizobium sp. LNJC384A00]
MSDEVKPDAAEPQLVRVKPNTDVFVGSLAHYANNGIGVSVTVLSQGVLISGQVMSNVDFFKWTEQKWGEATPQGGDAETAELVRTTLKGHAESTAQIMKERNAEGGADPDNFEFPVYLHLRDVRIMIPGALHAIKCEAWRSRMDQIAGFTIGQMTDE